MPFFSGDFNDPDYQKLTSVLAGLASGFGKAAMPSALPIGSGAALGMAAEGAAGGLKDAQAYQTGQIDQASKKVGLDKEILIENMLRRALGMPEMTAEQYGSAGARSPLFGIPSVGQTKPAEVQTPTLQSPQATGELDPEGNPIYAPAAAAPASAPAQAPSKPSTDAMRGALVQRMLLGATPTDYQKAKIYADSLPEGQAKTEAEQAAAKAAGIDVSADVRQGATRLLWDPTEGRYKVVFRNPQLPEGVILGENGEAEEVPGAMGLISKVEGIKAGAHAKGKMTEASFGNWLETGGLGMGTQTGGVKSDGTQSPIAPTFASRVSQLESHGDPNAANGASTAAGEHQFVNGTWLEQAKKYLPKEVLAGKTDDQILALRSNQQASDMVTNGYARDNMAALTKAGIKNIGAPELYLGHHFGPGGATAILKAAPNTPIEQVVSPEAMAANPDLKGMTVADVYSSARHGMQGLTPLPQQDNEGSKLQGTKIGNVQSVIPPISDAAPLTNRGEAYLKDRLKQWSETEDNWADSLPSNATGEQRALAIAEAFKATQSGKWAEEKGDIAAKLKAVGLGGLASSAIFGDPAKVQEALKNNFQSTLAQIRAFTSRPAAVEVQLASNNFANPNLQPEANLQIIGETVGTMRWERALINDWAQAKKEGWQDPQDFQRAWMQKNPQSKFIDAAIKEIGPLKGMKGAPAAIKVTPAQQSLITPENIEHTAKAHGQTVEQVKANLKARGISVPD